MRLGSSISASHRAVREDFGATVPQMHVEEDDQAEPIARPPAAGSAGAPAASPAPTPLSSEAAINLEHADPLAEADFHMAYGL